MSATINLLEELEIPYKMAGEHKNVRHGFVGINCPFCEGMSSSDFKFGIPVDGARYGNCWTCGPKSLYEILSLSCTPEQKSILLDFLRDSVPTLRRHERPTGKYVEPYGVGPMTPPHLKYLEQRGFNAAQIETLWDVRGIGQVHDNTAWSLFIPVTLHGEPVSWVCRKIASDHGGRTRYVAAEPQQESVHHKNVLYGSDLARHAIVVVEGPTKVWAGGPGFVCTFGVSTTPAQVANISRFPRVAICFDSEPAAQRRARELARHVECLVPDLTVVELESAPQMDLADKSEVAAIRKKFLEE